MKSTLRRPSPAFVVSCLALIAATSGTAVAAKTLITSTSQIKNGAILSADIKDGSVLSRDIKDGSVTKADLAKGVVPASGAGESTSATEAVRARGPVQGAETGGSLTVATLKGLAPGSYFISAKTVVAAETPQQSGLVDAAANNSTNSARCTLDASGNTDEASGTIKTPASTSPATLQLQLTRTLAAPADVTLRCESNIPWSAGGTSIVAVKVGSSTRTAVEG